MVAIFFAGLVAGTVHVITGPDHLAAVAPLALSQRQKSWLLGARWGGGHASGVILVAILAWAFREIFPVEMFSNWCERLVGVMLIGIGLWGLRKMFRFELHAHEHSHQHSQHSHNHSHDHLHEDGPHWHVHAHRTGHHQDPSHAHSHAAVAVGVLHGLAGGSHFLGVLPALAMPTRWAAAVYLLAFGIGTIITMAGYSFAFGSIGSRTQNSGIKFYKYALATCSWAAIVVGGYWLVF
ncbi:MAG: High-affinity nickel transporter [Bdellovibrio sp.]|nr:MAG: High-affinity nickel transporter [Bdellovibrio sp.]